jgi:hypothetical protein
MRARLSSVFTRWPPPASCSSFNGSLPASLETYFANTRPSSARTYVDTICGWARNADKASSAAFRSLNVTAAAVWAPTISPRADISLYRLLRYESTSPIAIARDATTMTVQLATMTTIMSLRFRGASRNAPIIP